MRTAVILIVTMAFACQALAARTKRLIPHDQTSYYGNYNPPIRLVPGGSVLQLNWNPARPTLEQPGQLCRPNAELSRDILRYEECCKKDTESGACLEVKSCRRVKSTCLAKDADGGTTTYEAFGNPECEACVAVEPIPPVEFETPD